jgi:hypothetical protein
MIDFSSFPKIRKFRPPDQSGSGWKILAKRLDFFKVVYIGLLLEITKLQ